MKKIEINSLTLITDDNNNIIGGYGFCDNDGAKPVIDKLIAGIVEKATTPKSPTCSCHCHCEEEEDPCETCIVPDCTGCEWETCPECGGELRFTPIGRSHTLVECDCCNWETVR